jgi:tetratricopeptide (TPR) repeat protein
VLYHEGRLALAMGRAEAAVRPLARLLDALPGYARARMLYAVALSRTGHPGEAVEQAVQAQKTDPALFDPELTPLPLLSRAAASAPGALPWKRLATFAELYGDEPLATLAWREVERRRPLTAQELVRLGWLELRHGKPGEALLSLGRAEVLDALTPYLLEGVARFQQLLQEAR